MVVTLDYYANLDLIVKVIRMFLFFYNKLFYGNNKIYTISPQ